MVKRLSLIILVLALFSAGCKGGCGNSADYDVKDINEKNAEEMADKILKDLDSL